MSVGIMDNGFSRLLDWSSRCFSVMEGNSTCEHMYSSFLLTSSWNTVNLNQETLDHHYPPYKSSWMGTLLQFCGTTFVKTVVYRHVYGTFSVSLLSRWITFYWPDTVLLACHQQQVAWIDLNPPRKVHFKNKRSQLTAKVNFFFLMK